MDQNKLWFDLVGRDVHWRAPVAYPRTLDVPIRSRNKLPKFDFPRYAMFRVVDAMHFRLFSRAGSLK